MQSPFNQPSVSILRRHGNRFQFLRGDERPKDDVVVGEIVCRPLALKVVFEVEEDADQGLQPKKIYLESRFTKDAPLPIRSGILFC